MCIVEKILLIKWQNFFSLKLIEPGVLRTAVHPTSPHSQMLMNRWPCKQRDKQTKRRTQTDKREEREGEEGRKRRKARDQPVQ